MKPLLFLVCLLGFCSQLPGNSVTLEQILELEHEQHHLKALENYLDYLDGVSIEEISTVSTEERTLYEEAKLFSKEQSVNQRAGEGPVEVAQELLQRYEAVTRTHPDYYLLNYLVSISHYVCGDFQKFYTGFIHSYVHLPEHYYAYKVKGMLCQQLMQAKKPGPEREKWTLQSLKYLQLALLARPEDTQLYAQLFLLSPKEDQRRVLHWCLQQILRNNHPVPRRHLAFWIDRALEHQALGEARAFVKSAKRWYTFSRDLQAAERRLHKA